MANLPKGRWPIGIRLEVLPGRGVVEQFDNAARYGFDVVELPGRFLGQYRDKLLAHQDRLALPISSISLGFRGSLVSADAEERRQCRGDAIALSDLCKQLGAAGLVMPPTLVQDPHVAIADPSPHRTIAEARDALLTEQLPGLATAAEERDVRLFIEPVNRFEADYIHRLNHAVRICEQVDHPGLGITADFYHMQLEELRPADSLRRADRWIRHVHVAENTRCEPGPGSLELTTGFEALRDIGYDGYVVVECRFLSGPAEEVLPRSVQYLRQLMHQARP